MGSELHYRWAFKIIVIFITTANVLQIVLYQVGVSLRPANVIRFLVTVCCRNLLFVFLFHRLGGDHGDLLALNVLIVSCVRAMSFIPYSSLSCCSPRHSLKFSSVSQEHRYGNVIGFCVVWINLLGDDNHAGNCVIVSSFFNICMCVYVCTLMYVVCMYVCMYVCR